MGKKVIHGGLILRATLASGSGDDLLTISSTGEVRKISGTPLTTTLTAGSIFLGNASNVATATAITGDVTINSSGVTAIGTGVIVNADVNASAAIAHSKMAALTASRALVSDVSGVVSVSSVTSTELGYVSGVTSAIQTQLGTKQATITGGATTITSTDLTANRALVSSATGKVAVASVTSTELGYVSGVTSAIQTQFAGKLSATITGAATGDLLYYNGSAWVNLPKGTDGQTLRSSAATILWDTPTINGIPIGGTDGQVLTKTSGTDFDADWETLTVASITDLTATAAELNVLDGITATTAELNYTDGVSSNIQTQLDGKQSSALPQNAIWVGNSSNVASALAGGTSGYVLTSVSGVPTWAAASAGSVPGADTQVLFNDAGSFGADAELTYNKTTDTLSVSAITLGVSTAAGASRTIQAGGSATDVGVNIYAKGAGDILLDTTGAGRVGFRSLDANSTVNVQGSASHTNAFNVEDGSGTDLFTVTYDGRIYGSALHNNAGAVTGTTNQYVASGTYTPTLVNDTNIASSTAFQCQYIRVGNVVTVSGKVNITPTAGGNTTTILGISEPIASTIANDYEVGGTAVQIAGTHVGGINGRTTTGNPQLVFQSNTTSAITFHFSFTYLIL